jgi:sugar/nucleoside kinase (ribokinase family)
MPDQQPTLVLIGHVGWAENETTSGTRVSLGGSGYAAAFAASLILPGRVGLVAQVGPDLAGPALNQLPINRAGLAVLPGRSAAFHITEHPDGTRSFRSSLGVAASPRFGSFPPAYFQAKHVHLGTMPPEQQLGWLAFLRDNGLRAPVSVDAFEHFVTTQPVPSRQACDRADLIFINEAEYTELYRDSEIPKSPTILKHGPLGADFISDGIKHFAAATPAADLVDGTGAGEILAGTYLALRAGGLTERRALDFAVRAASSSVTEFGVDGPRLTRELTGIAEAVMLGG